VLRKGSTSNKQAILYEVVTENTSEERTSERRRGEDLSYRQLELVPSPQEKPKPIQKRQFKAAEKPHKWEEE
jgi:superfamily II DNA or RNA helicase